MSRQVASFEDLVAFLGEEKAAFRQDAEAQIVELAARSGPFDGPVFVRWERNLPYVQILAPMIRDVAAERVHELEDAICRVNHAVPLAGFGFDFGKRMLYFRTTLPLDRDGMSAELMKRGILAAVANARDFMLPFRTVIDGDAGAHVLQLVIEQERAKRAARARDVASVFGE